MFQFTPLDPAPFASLFRLDDDELRARRARRVKANSAPGFPCRVGLQDAEVGEDLILTHYTHHDVDSPFRASHAIYVRADAAPWTGGAGEVPDMLRHRQLACRAFDQNGMLVGGQITPGQSLHEVIDVQFRMSNAAYLHVHFAAYGCFAAKVERVAT